MTKLMQDMVVKIARSEYTSINGAEPSCVEETKTWADTIIETKEDKGVFMNLVKDGLAEHSDEGKDSIVYLTENGFDLYKSFKGCK